MNLYNSTIASNERVWRIAQLAKLSFNHPSVVLTVEFFNKGKHRVVSSVQQLSVPLQHVCCSCSPSDLASHSSELPSAFFVFLVLIFLFFLVWLVSLCSRTRHASISLALPWLIAAVLFFSVSQSVTTEFYLSRMNQHGHWVYWCRWVEITV